MAADARLGTGDLALFALLAGVVTTCVCYRFGVDNHVAELPLVLRAIDPALLAGDFYTDAASAFGPRTNFTRAIAWIATPQSLASVYFWLTLLCNVAIAFVTALCARDLFGGSAVAGIGAAALVLSVSTFKLGYTGAIYADQLLASRATVPPLLLACWAALQGRALLCAGAAALAAWLHPTLGLEAGALALGMLLLAGGRQPRRVGPALLLFAVAAGFVVAPYLAAGRPDAEDFLAIETRFRHPHHSLPSTFPARDWLGAAAFLAATGVAFRSWRRDLDPPAATARAVLGLVAAVLLLCAGGAVFVELVPTAVAALARPFRLLLLVKWLGLVLIGGAAAHAIAHSGMRALWGGPGIALAAVAALAAAAPTRSQAALCLAFVLPVAASFLHAPRAFARGVALAAAVALLCHLFWGADVLPRELAALTSRLRPSLSLDERSGPASDVARWARTHTPPDAVFLTPPDLGIFRLEARRPIVVDFKAFPFQHAAMRAWRERLRESYGSTAAVGWAAQAELVAQHRELDEKRLARVAALYGARYAIVARDAPNAAPVVFENAAYKVLALRETEPD